MGRILGVTGTPGTGKKSVAPLVASMLKWDCVSLNDLALKNKIVEGRSGEVDTDKLADLVSGMTERNAVVFGHLLPVVLEPKAATKVFVLRCEPMTLKARLRARGYPRRKVRENVEAELIGLISSESSRIFGKKSAELDTTTTTPEEAARLVLREASSKGKEILPIDWTLNYGSSGKLEALLSD